MRRAYVIKSPLGVAVLGLAMVTLLCAAGDDEPSSVARKLMQDFAKCLVDRAAYRLRPALDLPVGESKTNSLLADLANADCLKDRGNLLSIEGGFVLRFQPSLLRGSIFDVLFAREFRRKPARDNFEGIISPSYPISISAINEHSETARRYSVSVSIGDCVVRAQPLLARQLVLSTVESQEEATAIKMLVPFFGPCIDEGHTIKFSRSVIRSMIAEPLYRLTKAAEGPHA